MSVEINHIILKILLNITVLYYVLYYNFNHEQIFKFKNLIVFFS